MKLLVIDGNSILNRAYYGVRLLSTKDGRFTNGIYGFLTILMKLSDEVKPDGVAIAFDLKAPTFRHKMFDGYKLNSRFFGTVQTTAVTAGNNDGTYRSLVEADYTVSDEVVHIFAGDLIPAGVAIAANVSYKEDNTIICKVFVKLPPYMSAFQVGTSFFNPKSLTENHYLTFGHNTLEHLKNYPVITVRATESND